MSAFLGSHLPRVDAEFGFFAHAAAQARQSTADQVEKLDHWEEFLTGAGAVGAGTGSSVGFKPLNLRLDYPPSGDVPSAASVKRPCASISIDISPSLAAMLRSGAASKGRTAYSTLISAWALTLRRQAENRSASEHHSVVPVDDLVFGTAFDLRGMTGLSTSETVGCFSTLLPVRCNVADVQEGSGGDGSFQGLAGHMNHVCRNAFKHPDVSLLGIIERLNPPRRAGGGNPLFSTCFSFVSLPRFDDKSDSIPDVTAVRFHEAAFELWLGIGEIAKVRLFTL